MKPLLLSALGVLLTFISACSTTMPGSAALPEAPAKTLSTYEIGVGDQLNINVWRNPELSLAVPVRPDGMISLPLVGDTVAAGKSADELSESLRESLATTYIRNPQVTVIVVDAASTDYLRRVRVTGAVEAPLSIPHREGMTVLDLVLEAGGLTEFAVANKSVLYRKTDDGVKAYAIRLGDILNKGSLDTNHLLAPSDIVTVPERTF